MPAVLKEPPHKKTDIKTPIRKPHLKNKNTHKVFVKIPKRKMSMIRALALVAMLAGSITVSRSQDDDLESCAPVAQNLSPCLSFIKGGNGGEKPSPSCCNGAKKLAGNAKTKQDRVAVCGCLKNILAMIGPYDKNRIPLIPKACGVSVQIPPIDKSTDCSKISAFEFGSAMSFELGNNHRHH